MSARVGSACIGSGVVVAEGIGLAVGVDPTGVPAFSLRSDALGSGGAVRILSAADTVPRGAGLS